MGYVRVTPSNKADGDDGMSRLSPSSSPLFTSSGLLALTLLASATSFIVYRYLTVPASSSSSRHRRHRRHDAAIPRPASLRHAYYVVRHGESTANVEGIISSSPALSPSTHGLTALGRSQAVAAASSLLPLLSPHCVLSLHSSPYLRALQTAQLIRDRLRVREQVEVHDELRERGFGRWNGGSVDSYAKVWQRDAEDDGHEEGGVESVRSVMLRASRWVLQREAEEGGGEQQRCVLIVSHGDVLQILQCWFEGRPGSEHRRIPHLRNAELRQLTLASPPSVADYYCSAVS